MRRFLDVPVTTGTNQTLLDILEAVDIRVYKTRGSDPQKDVSQAAKEAATKTPIDIARRLREFVGSFMNDNYFRANLSAVVYGKNEGLRFVLLEYDSACRISNGDPDLSLVDLKRLRGSGFSIEHSLAQEPTFTLDGRGFETEEQYASEIDRLGNLTLIESGLNSAARHKTPEQKASDPNLYPKSEYLSTRRLGVAISAKASPFGRADIDARTTTLIDFCVRRWRV
jgi:hypothetical protein